MGKKDLTQKNLELCLDVFADLINVLIYDGKQVVKQEYLHPAPTESVYYAEGVQLKDQLQDVGMDELQDGKIQIRYMIENQTGIDRYLVFRKAGYQGTGYRKQYDLKRFFPVVGLVLYWGRKRWKAPHDLKDFFHLKDLPVGIMDNVGLNLIEMTNLDLETRKKFKSDIRVIVDYLAERENYNPSRQKLKHPSEVLLMLSALTGDVRFEDIVEEVKDKEGIRMCELIDRYEKRGRALGKAEEIVSLGEELKWSVDEIINRLMNRLQIPDTKAREYYEAYKCR